MPIEGIPNLNNPGVGHTEHEASVNIPEETGIDIDTPEKPNGELTLEKPEDTLTAKELENTEAEQEQKSAEQEQLELSPKEEKIEDLENKIEYKKGKREELIREIKEEEDKLKKLREELGVPPTKEKTPNEISKERELEKLEAQRQALEKHKEILISKREKERLIQKEKEIILQETLDQLFKEFEAMKSSDRQNLSKEGKTADGQGFHSKSMGYLNQELVKTLAKTFIAGIKSASRILESFPELFKKFDQDLTAEARKRVEKRLREEEAKMAEDREMEPEELAPAEKLEVPEKEIPSTKPESETSPTEDRHIRPF